MTPDTQPTEITAVCHVRAPLLLEPVDRQVETLRACESEGAVDDLLLRSWPKEVTLTDETPYQEALESVERFEGWADRRGVSIRPPFRERTATNQISGETTDVLIMVNDIAGFADPEMPVVCEEYDAAVAKMASPPNLERPGAVEETDWAARKSVDWAERADYVDQVYEALKQNGLTDKTIVDPAFGGWSEAQTLENDRETFRRLREFRALDRPMLVSINRKNFLGEVAGRETDERLPVSLAATSMAVERGAHVIRTHDVAETRDAALIGDAFTERSRTVDDDLSVTRLDVHSSRELRTYLDERGVDPTVADDWYALAIEVEGLRSEDRDRIRSIVDDADASVYRGTNNQILIVGSVTGISAVKTRLRDERGDLSSVGESLAQMLE